MLASLRFAPGSAGRAGELQGRHVSQLPTDGHSRVGGHRGGRLYERRSREGRRNVSSVYGAWAATPVQSNSSVVRLTTVCKPRLSSWHPGWTARRSAADLMAKTRRAERRAITPVQWTAGHVNVCSGPDWRQPGPGRKSLVGHLGSETFSHVQKVVTPCRTTTCAGRLEKLLTCT